MFLCIIYGMHGQENSKERPKLIVGLVIDQMRFDKLYTYNKKYSDGGFRRLIREGFNYKNAHYNYVPTVTAAGHSSIYTGTTPSLHGIIGNSWYSRSDKKVVGNVEDRNEKLVGSISESSIGATPKNLLTTTISDQLRLSTNFKSKVLSVSLKDRGAILPGGHSPNGVFWYDGESSPGYFVTSTYYMKKLPGWVTDFNKLQKPNRYLDSIWNPLYPIEEYTESTNDDNGFEKVMEGKKKPTFPYDFKTLRKEYKKLDKEYSLIKSSPYGNSLLTEFAIECIANEHLGQDGSTDLINISYSVPDIIGHAFGPNSIEYEDVYIRLDRDLERLLDYLDAQIGNENYLLFLTADHGAMPVASFLKEHKFPVGIINIEQCKESLSTYLNKEYGDNQWIEYFEYEQVYLNRDLISQLDIDIVDVQNKASNFLVNQKGVNQVLTAYQIQNFDYVKGIRDFIQNGYRKERSGDLVLSFSSGYTIDSTTNISHIRGATHGSAYNYDTHVPLLWFGASIPQGESVRRVLITDIAASLAMQLNIQMPSAGNGTPMFELLNTN